MRCVITNKTSAIRYVGWQGEKKCATRYAQIRHSFVPINDLHALRLIFKIHYVKPHIHTYTFIYTNTKRLHAKEKQRDRVFVGNEIIW